MKSTDKMAESAIFLCMQCDEKHGWVMGGKKKVPHILGHLSMQFAILNVKLFNHYNLPGGVAADFYHIGAAGRDVEVHG